MSVSFALQHDGAVVTVADAWLVAGRTMDDASVPAALHLAAGFSSGRGVCIGDGTGDGLADVYVVRDAASNLLLVTTDGGATYSDVAPAWNLAGTTTRSLGCTMADVNYDGSLDVYITFLSNQLDELWPRWAKIRRASSTKQGPAARLSAAPGPQQRLLTWTATGQWTLWCVILTKQSCSSVPAWRKRQMGTVSSPPPPRRVPASCHTPQFVDVNGDGAVNIVHANRDKISVLLINDGTGQFTATTVPGFGESMRIWGAGVADIDGDLDFDVFGADESDSLVLWPNTDGQATLYVRHTAHADNSRGAVAGRVAFSLVVTRVSHTVPPFHNFFRVVSWVFLVFNSAVDLDGDVDLSIS